MKTLRGILLAVFLVGVLCALAGLGLFAYRQKLGLSLAAPTQEVILTNTPVVAEPATAIPMTEVPVTPPGAPTVTPTSDQAAACGETATWNVLVLGSDLNETSPLRGSDLTRVMRVDFPNRKVTIYAFPRDLWVDTAGLGLTNPTINATQLGEVFYEGRIRSPQFGVPEIMVDGLRVSTAAISKNFTVQTDHYLALDLNQLPAIVDAVGGIPINVPERTTDLFRPFVIQAGQQTLTGEQAANYSRAFMGSDFDRIRRNQILLEAMRQKLLDPAVFVKIPALYVQFSAVIITDFTPEQITHLACLLQNISPDAIVQESVKPEWTSPGPRGSLLWSKVDVINRLRELGLIQ
jgi:LCP family protein required for cell wall assembly